MVANGMELLNSRERLHDLNISSYPHLKKESQNKVHRNYYVSAYPVTKESVAISTLSFAKMLSGDANG